jgi:hypothetical protein
MNYLHTIEKNERKKFKSRSKENLFLFLFFDFPGHFYSFSIEFAILRKYSSSNHFREILFIKKGLVSREFNGKYKEESYSNKNISFE